MPMQRIRCNRKGRQKAFLVAGILYFDHPTLYFQAMRSIIANVRQELKKKYHRYLGPYRDVVVVSYPKSGRTWLRVMLNDLGIIPSYEHNGSQNARGLPYQDLPDDKSAYSGKRVLFMVRDPRDTVVSAYFQMTKRHQAFEGSMAEFIRDDRYGIKKVLRFHEIWYNNRQVPVDFKMIRYEDLHRAPLETMEGVLDFFDGKKRHYKKLQQVIDLYQFNNMHRLEQQGYFNHKFKGVLRPGDANDQESYKTRKGKVGGFYAYFSEEDLAYCKAVMQENPNPFYSGEIA